MTEPNTETLDCEGATLATILERLSRMTAGQTGSFVIKRIASFPVSGRYEPSYIAECQAKAQRESWILYTAVVGAYYRLVSIKVPEGRRKEVSNLMAVNAGAHSLVGLEKLIQENLDWVKPGTLDLPILSIEMRTAVRMPEQIAINEVTIDYTGEVFVRRVK